MLYLKVMLNYTISMMCKNNIKNKTRKNKKIPCVGVVL